MAEKDTGLATRDGDLPAPVYRGQQMVEALKQYKELQAALDDAMPDQIKKIGDRSFRKKGYWRAIATAFDLSVKPVEESRIVVGQLEDGTDNYVYNALYVASTPSGRSVTGDGTCAASEKTKGRMEASEHNVRSHAHTRAYNRAVSNLVGFGEVSAEEADRVEHDAEAVSTKPAASQASSVASANGALTVKEVRRGDPDKKKPGWVKVSDGREGSTFDTKVIDRADEFKKANTPIVVEFKETQKGDKTYVNLVKLEAASAQTGLPIEQAKPLLEDKEPFGQPEKILTVVGKDGKGASVATADAKYWEVQSDRHQYLTNKAEHRVTAEGARVLGAKVIIVCKPMLGKDGLPRRSADGVPQYEMVTIEDAPQNGAASPVGVQEGEVVANDEMPAFAGME